MWRAIRSFLLLSHSSGDSVKLKGADHVIRCCNSVNVHLEDSGDNIFAYAVKNLIKSVNQHQRIKQQARQFLRTDRSASWIPALKILIVNSSGPIVMWRSSAIWELTDVPRGCDKWWTRLHFLLIAFGTRPKGDAIDPNVIWDGGPPSLFYCLKSS